MSTDGEKDDPKRKQNDPFVNKDLLYVRVNGQAQAYRDRSQYQADQKVWLLASFEDIIDTDDNNNNHSSRNIRTDLKSALPRILSDSLKKETRRDPSRTATTEHEHSTHCTSTTNAKGDDRERWANWVGEFRGGFTAGQGQMYIVGLSELLSRAPPLS